MLLYMLKRTLGLSVLAGVHAYSSMLLLLIFIQNGSYAVGGTKWASGGTWRREMYSDLLPWETMDSEVSFEDSNLGNGTDMTL